MKLTVERARADEEVLVEHLLQWTLYEGGMEPGPDGLINWGESLEKYFTKPDHLALVFRQDERVVGYSLAKLGRNPTGPDGKTPVHANFVEEFFVLRPHRRKGVGTAAATAIISQHPGVWMTSCWPGGMGVEFWPRVAASTGRPTKAFGPDQHRGYPGQHVWVIEDAGVQDRVS